MQSWNAASNCTGNSPGCGPAYTGFCGRANLQVIPSWFWWWAGMPDPWPTDGQGRQRACGRSIEAAHWAGRRAGRQGTRADWSPSAHTNDTFPILNMCLELHRNGTGSGVSNCPESQLSDQRLPTCLAPNEWEESWVVKEASPGIRDKESRTQMSTS